MDNLSSHEEIKRQQRETWNKFSPGWKKWESQNDAFTSKVSQAIIDAVELSGNDHVLDIASGTGEPALTIAGIVNNGKVVATDIAEDMLAVAEENAKKLGLKNIEIRRCSADALPFGDHSFDAVTCRFGFMFFPDIQKAADEIYRVLKPDGRMSTGVWASPEKNPFATTIMEVIKKHVEMPDPAPDAPGLFRCAKQDYVTSFLRNSGFKDITTQEIQLNFIVDSINVYWSFMNEIAAPVVMGMSKADDTTKKKIKDEVFENAGKFMENDRLSMPGAAWIIRARK